MDIKYMRLGMRKKVNDVVGKGGISSSVTV